MSGIAAKFPDTDGTHYVTVTKTSGVGRYSVALCGMAGYPEEVHEAVDCSHCRTYHMIQPDDAPAFCGATGADRQRCIETRRCPRDPVCGN